MEPLPSLIPPCQVADPFLLIFMSVFSWLNPCECLQPQRVCFLPRFLAAHSDLPEAPGDVERFAGDPNGLGRRQEDDGRGYILGESDSAQRSLRFRLLAEVTLRDSRRVGSL